MQLTTCNMRLLLSPTTKWGFYVMMTMIIIIKKKNNNNNNTKTMFMMLSSWQSHCQSSPGSFDECRTTPSGHRPKTKPDDLRVCLYRLPESTSTIAIWCCPSVCLTVHLFVCHICHIAVASGAQRQPPRCPLGFLPCGCVYSWHQ